MQFCWFGVLLGEQEDIAHDEVPEWGVLPLPTSFAQAVPAPHVVDCDRVADHAEHQGRKRLCLIRHSQRETVAASSPTQVDSSAEGVRGQCGPQDSESTPQSVQVARLGVVASQVGRPEVFPLAGDDSDQFGDEEDTESVDGFEESVEGDEEVPHSIPDTVVEVAVPRGAVMREALEGLDGVAAGVSHDNQRAQTCTFEGPGLQKHPKPTQPLISQHHRVSSCSST